MLRFMFPALAAMAIFGSGADAAKPMLMPSQACEIRVWQSRDYVSAAPAPYAAYGLIGAIVQSSHDSRYPAGSTERQMEIELRQDNIGPIINAVPWNAIIPAKSYRISFSEESLTREGIKALRSSTRRNSQSIEPCYLELYVDRQTFLGGMVQSNLMSEFTARIFTGEILRVANGKTFKKVKGFPAKEAETADAANASFRSAFANNLNDFARKKIATGPISVR